MNPYTVSARRQDDYDCRYPPAWTEQALCAEVDDAIFFPEKGDSTREAEQVCRGCVVREPCLRYALDHDERFGIWAGFSEQARRRVGRAHRAGRSLKDIIADADAAFYARQDRSAEVARAPVVRQKARERAKSAAARTALDDLERAS